LCDILFLTGKTKKGQPKTAQGMFGCPFSLVMFYTVGKNIASLFRFA